MKVTYKRELDQNYMVIEQEEFKEQYQVEMLVRNQIPGLLSCRLSLIDRKALFYYEITSRQSLRLVLERKRLSSRELRLMLEELLAVVQVCSEYLLDTDKIFLNPDYIYLEPDSWELSFCYFPFCQQDIQEELLELAEYLLDHLDSQDQKVVSLGYEFYRMAGEKYLSLGEMLGKWKEEEEITEEKIVELDCDPIPAEDKSISSETMILKRKKGESLVLRSENPAYPDMKITGDSFLIGKKKDVVDGWIKARGISRIHGKISKEEGQYYLTDLNSTNGTYLNGGRLEVNEKARIRCGDCVGFGDVRYVVEV